MAEPITIQKLIDASLDSNSLETAVNGDENTNVSTRLGVTYPTLAKAIKIILSQGTIDAAIYKTKALMESAGGIDNDYALVTDDTVASNNGYYQKRNGDWVYLPYNFNSIFNELASNYVAPQGVIAAGTDLNTINRAGVYLGKFGSNYINSPVTDTFLMIVASAGVIGKNNSRWVSKTIFDFADNKTFTRVDDINNINASRGWYSNNEIDLSELDTSEKSIVGAINEVLAVASPYKGLISSPVLKDISESGLYVLTNLSGNVELPDGYSDSVGLFSVERFGTFIHQKLIQNTSKPHIYYTRSVRNNVTQPWVFTNLTNSPTPPTVTEHQSPYEGKTAVFLGDSITENGDYPARVGARLGLTAINGGFGGTRMTEMTSNLSGQCGVDIADAIASGDWSIVRAGAQKRLDDTASRPDNNLPVVDRLQAVNWSNVDYVICFWGTNDWSNNVPLGVDSNNNRTTIKGATNYIITKLLTKYPHLKIMFVAPMFRARINPGDAKDSDTTQNTNGDYLYDLGDAIIERAQAWHLPAFDLYRNCGFNILNYSLYLRDQTIDGLHPYSDVGHQHLADKISAAFASNF